jgi:hypothetical protein
MRILKMRPTAYKIDPMLLRQLAKPVSEAIYDTLLPATKLAEINYWSGVGHAPIRSLFHFLELRSHMQQGFRRYTATVEANTPWIRGIIDQSDLHTKICG